MTLPDTRLLDFVSYLILYLFSELVSCYCKFLFSDIIIIIFIINYIQHILQTTASNSITSGTKIQNN